MNTETEVLKLCETLKQKRFEKKISQTDLGQLLSLTHCSISRMENIQFNISLEKFIKWADALGFEITLKQKK